MNQSTTDVIDSPLLKVATAWAAIGITSWADFASFLAAAYSMCLLAEWLWKKLIKPLAMRRGWIKNNEWLGGEDEI